MAIVAWHEDVDRAMKRVIKKCVRVPKRGKLVQLPDKNIVVRKPEEDYKIEVYPSVSIYNISDAPDLLRYQRYQKRNFERVAYAKANYQKPLNSINLTYQIDFWAKFKTDMNEMVRSWIASGHYDQFNLWLTDDEEQAGDVDESINVQRVGNITHSDLLEEKERIFHDIISYVMWVEIEDETVYTTPIAERVSLNVHGEREISKNKED